MIGYREPDGLERTTMILASLKHEVRVEKLRRRVLAFNLVFFGAVFAVLVAGETLFATMMFSIIQIEILGTAFSGAAFALLVPTVIGYAHVRLHHEGDHFMRWWLHKLSGVGILIFALGVSLMIGFSAWQASQDAVNAIASGPSGTFGGQSVGGTANEASGLASWIAVIPNSLLFLGLSFGAIITISFASFCLGRALQAFNMLTQTPRIGRDVRTLITSAAENIAALRTLRDDEDAARRRLPFDVKVKFAREAANAAWTIGQKKLAAGRRTFDPVRKNDPLGAILGDPVAGSIPASFKTEDEYARHIAEQMDVMRAHNVLRVLTGVTPTGKDSR